MKTSYREISRKEFEVSVSLDGEQVVLGIISSDQNGKWSLSQTYFSVGAEGNGETKNTDSMVECGRAVVQAWERAEKRRKFDEKLRKLKLEKEKTEQNRQKGLDESYYDSLWNIDSYDPFGGEP